LERAGCHVVYGVLGLKTHCKTALVVRQEKGTLRRYAHIGTGNYNPKTARLYEDVGLLTADERIGADLTDLFNYLTGYSKHTDYGTLLVAPHSVRSSMLQMIDREVSHQERGRPASITMKANSIVDEQIVDAIYGASQAGVPVDLVVRGICAVRPGVPGLSETIRVRSILGRFLEHSRIFRFSNGGTPEHWLGSADMMHRNLDRRVEVMVRVADAASQQQLDLILDQAMAETTRAWELRSDGEWHRNSAGRADSSARLDHQAALIRLGRLRASSGS